jgi:hypothetical protein
MTERTFHLLYALVLAGLIVTGVALGKGRMLHADPQCATEVMTK